MNDRYPILPIRTDPGYRFGLVNSTDPVDTFRYYWWYYQLVSASIGIGSVKIPNRSFTSCSQKMLLIKYFNSILELQQPLRGLHTNKARWGNPTERNGLITIVVETVRETAAAKMEIVAAEVIEIVARMLKNLPTTRLWDLRLKKLAVAEWCEFLWLWYL